jgi:hypothetical protein
VIAALLPRLVLWLWFFAALLGGPHLLLRLPPAGLPVTIVILAVVAVRLVYRTPTLRLWVARLPLRAIVLLHVTRIAGVGLLVLHLRGAIDGDFAEPIGLAELAIGVMAIPVAFAPLDSTRRLRAVSIWNIAGITELVLAVALGSRLASADPDFFRALAQPPLVAIPLFAIPLLAASHFEILLRSRRSSAATPPPPAVTSADE